MSALTQDPPETRLHAGGVMLTPLPEGALWWADRRLLIVSDLHLEKGSAYAARGQLLPPYDTSATLSIVEGLMERLAPETIVSLGDSFHDGAAETRLSPDDAARVRALTAATDWIWVEGNHDPDPPAHLGGRAAKVLRLDGLVLRHEPEGDAGEIAGHLHPCAKVSHKGRSVRRRCFAADGARIVMPALGAYTGGLNVCDPAFERVFPNGLMAFALGPDRVYALASKRLRPDGGALESRWRL
ncbi:MAG: ligase-associated DNA damage response endonuclease PdeM [Pseudomonadota bacterium]